MFAFLFLAGIAILCLYLIVVNNQSRIVQLGSLIPGPNRIPYIGTYGVPKSGRGLLEFQNKMTEKYGNPYKMWLGNNLLTVIVDPVDAEVVLNSQHALDKGLTYNFLQKWLGTGLLTSSGPKWHKRRKALTSTFHFKILEQFIEVFNQKGMKFLEVMEKRATGEVFNIQTDVSNLTLDVICETAMGVQLNAQENPEYKYIITVKSMVDYLSRIRHRHWTINKLFTRNKLDKMIKILHNFTNSVINAKKLERRLTANSETSDGFGVKKKTAFLELLLNLSEEATSSVVTHEDIREEVDTFMFEGHDTTSSVISSTLYLLGKHQNVQDKLVEEILRFIPNENYQLTYTDLKEMKYLEMVLKEVMRLYPAVPSFARHISKDIKLPSGYTLPSGSYVSIDVYHLQRNPKYYPNPEEFNPDNFLLEKSLGRHSHAFIPFSAGPRNCIGQKFAMLEMKATISRLLYKYKLEYGGSDIQPSVDIILNSLNGYPLRVTLRQAHQTPLNNQY